MINLLYITNSLNTYSETFIQNTVRSFVLHPDVNIIIATTKKGVSNLPSVLELGSSLLTTYLIAVLKKVGFSKIGEKFSHLQIKRKLGDRIYEVVWIDFGDNGIQLYNFFNLKGKRVVLHLHGYDVSKLLFNPEYCKKLALFSKNNKIIVPSLYNKKRLILSGCDSDNIVVCPYAYYGKINEMSNIELSREKPLLLFVGRFVEKKDPRILIYTYVEVIKRYQEVKMVLIGDGHLFPEVKALIKKYGIEDKVVLTGSLSHAEVLSWMQKATIYVQHSITTGNGDQEGYPNSILEAHCSGLPVVSTIHAGIPEIVTNGLTGFLVQEFDFQGMADYIIQLLENPELAKKMGNNALGKFINLANPARRIEKLLDILRSDKI